MRAVVCEELGSVVVSELTPIEPGPGQVVIDVEAAGVNYVDALFVRGRYQIKPPLPFVPGGEVAGTVAAVGPDVTEPAVGTRVLATCGLGGFASQVAVPAAAAVPIPERLDALRAATFTQSYCTGLYGLRDRGGLRAGETVLVLGAGDGVGRRSRSRPRWAPGCWPGPRRRPSGRRRSQPGRTPPWTPRQRMQRM